MSSCLTVHYIHTLPVPPCELRTFEKMVILLDISPTSGATYYNFTDFLHLTNIRYQRCYAIVQFISKTKVISGTSRCSISVMPLGWGVRQPSLPRISPSLLCCKLLFQGTKARPHELFKHHFWEEISYSIFNKPFQIPQVSNSYFGL